MPEALTRIVNPLGLHARAAAVLVREAAKYKSQIWVSVNGVTADGKSILGVLTLAASQGMDLAVKTEGEDADAALAALLDLIGKGFGEI